MKRKIIVIITAIILTIQNLHAAAAWLTPRIWFENDYSSRKNVINMESLFYLPTMDTIYPSNSPTGTYSSVNTLGNFGCAYCNHDIIFTVQTDGKFVSESDPTKYREFYIAIIPRVRYDTLDRKNSTIDDKVYCMDRTYQGGEVAGAVLAPNTRDVSGNPMKTLTITAPAISMDPYTKYYVGPDGEQHVFRFWCDVLICLPALTQEDIQHLIESDDYSATVTVSWTCAGEGECNTSHSGSFQFNLRGYYKTQQGSQDSLAMFVVPTSSSVNLDIRSILERNTQEENIAQMNVYTTTVKKSTNIWARFQGSQITEVRVKPFISANSSWNQQEGQNPNSFALTNGITSIPFSVIVRDPDHTSGNVSGYFWEFDGSDYWGKNNMNYIDLTNYVVRINDRQGTEYNMISFTGDVYISFSGQTIPNPLASGIYSEDIYYYIVYI